MGQFILLLAVAIVFYFIGAHEQHDKLKRVTSTLDDMYAMNDRVVEKALYYQSKVEELQAELAGEKLTNEIMQKVY